VSITCWVILMVLALNPFQEVPHARGPIETTAIRFDSQVMHQTEAVSPH
jgi:hypothetical protein